MRAPLISVALFMLTSQMLGQEPRAGAVAGAEDAVIELADTAYRFEDDGRGSFTQTLRVRIVTPGGQAAFSQLYLTLITPVERGEFEYVRTHKSDGRVLAAGPSAAVDVRQELGEEGLDGIAYKAVAPADLAAGDILEWRTVKRWDALAKDEFWSQHDALAGPRVERETISVDVPARRMLVLRHEPTLPPEVLESGDRRVYRWTIEARAAAQRREPLTLFALTTFRDWAAVGRWFAGLQVVAGDERAVRAKALELTNGKLDAREKAVAIYRWVSRSIRYVGAPFASSGYRPRPAAEVLRSGWGDCKDTHALLAALLREAGVEAAPVLVASGGTLPFPTVPSPSQFDHVVTLVRLEGGALWLDGTLGVARPGEVAPALRGSQGLVVESRDAALVAIPEDPTPATVSVTLVAKVSETGVLDADAVLSLDGGAGLVTRLLARQAGVAGVKAFLESLGAAQSPGAVVTEPASSDPLDLDGPFILRYHLRHDTYLGSAAQLGTYIPSALPALVAQQATAREEARTKSVPAAGEATPGEAATQASTRTPAVEVKETITLAFPAGARLAPPLPVKVGTAAGSYESAYALDGSSLTVRRHYRVPAFASPGESAVKTTSLRALVNNDVGQEVMVDGWTPVSIDAAVKSAEELKRLGAGALAAGRVTEAADLLAAAVAKAPDDPDALRALANAALAAARWAEAERAARRLVERDPLDTDAGMLVGRVQLKRARFPEAIATLRGVVSANPYGPKPWIVLALICRQSLQPEAALEALRAAARVDQGNPGTRLALAGMLHEQGHSEEARRIYAEVAALPAVRDFFGTPPPLGADLIGPIARMSGIMPGLAPSLPAGAGAEGAESRLAEGLTRLAGMTGVDREFAAPAVLLVVAEALIVLGHADLEAGRLESARDRLDAALELTLDLAPALDLVELDARQGRFDEALRLWSVARHAPGAKMPVALAKHLERKDAAGTTLEDTLSTLRYQMLDRRRLTFATGQPAGGCGDGETKHWVVVRAAVGGNGVVTAAEALSGPTPCRERAVRVLKAAKLPRLVVGGKAISTPRTVAFLFHPGGTIEAQYGYGLDPYGDVEDFGARTNRSTK